MEKSPKNTNKNSLLLLFVLLLLSLSFSLPLGAGQRRGPSVGIVESVTGKGKAFVIRGKEVEEAKVGQTLYNFSEIMTEEGAQVSVASFNDLKFHLSGQGHVQVVDRLTLELKRGYLWAQSYKRRRFTIQTPNAHILYEGVHGGGELVVSYDGGTEKSQVLVISGAVKVSNLLQRYPQIPLSGGEFSFVDNDYNRGVPRQGTMVGYRSFQKVTALFEGVSLLPGSTYIEGVIARRRPPKRPSVSSSGKRRPASYFRPPFRPSYRKKSGASLNIFGRRPPLFLSFPFLTRKESTTTSWQQQRPGQQRLPASTSTSSIPRAEGFEQALLEAYEKQKRHKKQVNRLIKEFKNYQQDYQTTY